MRIHEIEKFTAPANSLSAAPTLLMENSSMFQVKINLRGCFSLDPRVY